MKLTYIIDDLEFGGAQVHLARLVNGLAAGPEFDIEIVSLGPVSEAIREWIPDVVPIVRTNMESIRRPGFYLSFLKLTAHLKRRGPDIVHTYLNTSNVFGLAAAMAASADRVVTSRRDMGQFRSGRVGALERSLSRRFASRVFCVCRAVADRTRETENIPADRIRVVLNGVDVDRFAPRERYRSNGPPVFGMVATMNRVDKGHGTLIEAVAGIPDRIGIRPEIRLAGDGPLRSDFEALSSRLGTSGSIRFVGEQKDTAAFLDGVDSMVVPSFSEGISNALLEAMAKGLPVIATAVDGNLEVVQDGSTGILVPPRDPGAIGEAMLAYVNNPALAETHGRNGRKRAEELFSMKKMLDSYRREYRNLVSGSRSTACCGS